MYISRNPGNHVQTDQCSVHNYAYTYVGEVFSQGQLTWPGHMWTALQCEIIIPYFFVIF